jgi:DNA-binding NtrC family response regulator
MSEQSRTQRVLVVEDEARLRQGILTAIPAMGFVPVGAGSGEEAIAIMQRDPCEVILLDLRLPGMNGMELLEVVRQRWPHSQVIITTGFGNLQLAQKAMHLDAVEFLTKPCTLHDLETAIARACERHTLALRHGSGIKPALLDVEAVEEPRTPKTAPGSRALRDVERNHILAVLESNNGNRTAAAQELGISRRTLHERLREYREEGFIM